MTRRDFRWETDWTQAQLVEAVKKVAEEFDLAVGPASELQSIPGSQHWHLRRANESGVLEVTLVSRTWTGSVDVHANRNAEWIELVLSGFVARILEQLGASG